jgi:acetyl-CoA carboxylase biotin carboxyl carrier protein
MASLKIDESIFDKLAEVLKKHNLTEIEYKQGETKIKISANSLSSQYSSQISNIPPSNTNFLPATEQNSESKKEIDYKNHPGALKSPMVGTCYLSPEPGARNFVMIGDVIQEGQPLLIIEAMKVMNLIKAPKSGKIIHIAATNSMPTEFGQLLLVIE